MKTMKLIATMMTLSMLAAAFAGCLGGDDDEDEKTTVKIGFLNPITGPLEPNAPVFTWSANEAINDLNAMYADYNFELIEQDSGCDGAVAEKPSSSASRLSIFLRRLTVGSQEPLLMDFRLRITRGSSSANKTGCYI